MNNSKNNSVKVGLYTTNKMDDGRKITLSFTTSNFLSKSDIHHIVWTYANAEGYDFYEYLYEIEEMNK